MAFKLGMTVDLCMAYVFGGVGLAQWLYSIGLEIQKSRFRISPGAQEKLLVFPSQKGCADSVWCAQPPCVHTRIRKTMHAR